MLQSFAVDQTFAQLKSDRWLIIISHKYGLVALWLGHRSHHRIYQFTEFVVYQRLSMHHSYEECMMRYSILLRRVSPKPQNE